MGVRFS